MESGSGVLIILLIVFAGVIAAIVSSNNAWIKKNLQNKYCPQCGYRGQMKKKIAGSGLIELVLWLFFLLPGLIYSMWRSSNRYPICPECNNKGIIPADSEKAKAEIAQSSK
jgi:predicted RNA-binding Zn-ribbon protein involved in translation (DUF1610 family)